MRQEYVEAVSKLTAMIPPGSAVSYGDVAELLGAGGARQVGAVMSRHGSGLVWWRVLRANGAAPRGHEADALEQYLREGTPLRGDPDQFLHSATARWRVDLRVARWQPSEQEFAKIGALSLPLGRQVPTMSVADDGMTE